MGITLGHEGRKVLCFSILFCNGVNFILSLLLTSEMYYITYYIPTHREITPRFDAFYVPIMTTILSTSMIFVCIVVAKVWSEVMSDDIATQNAVARWVTLTFFLHFMAALIFLIHGIMVLIRSGVRQSSVLNFQRAMDQYKSSLGIKAEIDWLQLGYHCCGGAGYSDWVNIDWVDGHYQDANRADVPFSCCDPWSPRPCVHEAVDDDSRHTNYRVSRDLTLYKDGCGVKIERFVHSMLLSAGIFGFFIGLFSFLSVIFARLVQTSFLNAVHEGDPQSCGYGRFLFYRKRKTIFRDEKENAPLIESNDRPAPYDKKAEHEEKIPSN